MAMDIHAPCTLTEKIAALRATLTSQNPEPTSEDVSAFPLWAFLIIYIKARRECSLDYMKGAQLLHDWLTVGQEPLAFTLPESLLTKKLHICLRSGDMYDLGKILSDYDTLYNVASWQLEENKMFHTLLWLKEHDYI